MASVRLTRRKWAAIIATVPLYAQVDSHTPPPGGPAPLNSAATPEARLQKAYADVKDASGLLSKIEVPMNIEPAFLFKA
jgi:hypothetical protein